MIAEPLLENPVPCSGEAVGSPRGCNLAPWEAEPYRLWSLWELMNTFPASTFMRISRMLETLSYVISGTLHNLTFVEEYGTGGEEKRAQANEKAAKMAKGLAPFAIDLEYLGLRLSTNTVRKIEAAYSNLEQIPDSSRLLELVTELQGRITEEMEDISFFFLRPEQAEIYRNPQKGWELVIPKYNLALRDIEEASKCLALGRPTACAFHLMKVTEFGLRSLGAALCDPSLDPSTNPSWNRVLERSERELQKPVAKRSPEWSSDEAFFSTATANLRAVQYAWRNPGLHVERDYSEEEAQEIYNAIRGFMRHLSTKLSG